MNQVAWRRWILLGLLLLCVGRAWAAPSTLNYQGVLTDGDGAALSGSVSMTFSIYDVYTGGAVLWSEQLDVQVDNGAYGVVLGADPQNGLDPLMFNQQLFLGVSVAADPEMTPRSILTATPYAITASTLSTTCPDGSVLVYNAGAWECGMVCADCPLGQTDCGTFCSDLNMDRNNCGACGNVCGPGEICSGGICELSCQSGLVDCGGACVDLVSDRDNCGGCGEAYACVDGSICIDGTCQISCQPDLTVCGGVSCINLMSDRSNCGACGYACGEYETCVAGNCQVSCPMYESYCGGTCVETDFNWLHCGSCFNSCADGERCVGGACQLSCQSGLTNCGGVCTNLMSDNEHCGDCTTICTPGTGCVNGVCQ